MKLITSDFPKILIITFMNLFFEGIVWCRTANESRWLQKFESIGKAKIC